LGAKILNDLDIADTGDIGDSRLMSNGVELIFQYNYYSSRLKKNCIGKIFFDHVIAYRFSDEMHSEDFCGLSFCMLVEIENSNWLKKLTENDHKHIYHNLFEQKHFALFLKSNGYFEIIAAEYKIFDPQPGELNTDFKDS